MKVVLFPLPMKGHMNPMLQLGRKLHSNGFSIAVIHTKFNSPDPTDNPMFTFHAISDGLSEAETSFQNLIPFFTTINKKCEKPFRDCLYSLVTDGNSTSTTFLIVDPFWHFARAVAHSLDMRAVVLMTFNVYCSYILLAYRGSHSRWNPSGEGKIEKAVDMGMVVAEFKPLRIKDLPRMSEDPDEEEELVLEINREMEKCDGIVFNSFKELESEALAMFEKDCSIPLFPCGPVVETVGAPQGMEQHNLKCISWLDEQQPNTVVYISLGTVVSLTKLDFEELAWGVAKSNHPFLWVVHSGSVREKESLMFPEGITGKGLVVKWAPQQEVLAHPAVGAFLTHSGWNSTLESICAGVPMLCMPFKADQFANARLVSEVWKIGIYFEDRIHRSTVQEAITRLMQLLQKDDEIRANITSLKNKAQQSLQIGGSSYKCFHNLVQYIRASKPPNNPTSSS